MSNISHTDPDWTAYIERSRELDHEARVIRERVVSEYLYDFNWTKACLRCGFRAEFAEDNGKRFRQDPYCIWRVKTLARERNLEIRPDISTAQALDEQAAKRADILTALEREANYFGPGSSAAARVSALGKLAQLRGMEPVKQAKIEHKVPGVMLSPGIAAVGDWESVAQQAQVKLRDETMDAVSTGNGESNVH